MATHAAMPLPRLIDDERLRIHFGPRDADGRTRTAVVDVHPDEPSRIIELYDRPALDLGKRGTFDDSGAMPSCLIEYGADLWLFYIGWNQGVTVPYRNAIGLAVSLDGGLTFTRVHDGPVVDRSRLEPYFVSKPPFVRREGGTWKMWYASATGWVGEPPSPAYVIEYAQSRDGMRLDARRRHLHRTEITQRGERATMGRAGRWHRPGCGTATGASQHRFRTDPKEGYRLGYAESPDGVSWGSGWTSEPGVERSAEGWDSETMVAYPGLYEHRGRRHLLYNGNGFGRSGIGHAVSDEPS